jgi:outer membrane immunogenic protein
MRNICAAATFAVLTLTGGAATAADVYSGGLKDAPSYVNVASWVGLYLGANAGYAWSAKDGKLDAAALEYCDGSCYDEGTKTVKPSGGFGGGQIGYNWQQGHLVFGLETDIQGSGVRDKASVSLLDGDASAFAKSELDWFGTFRGRIGYTFDRSLIYFTGGLAYGGVKDILSVTAPLGDITRVSKDETRTGYVLGGGLEYRVSPGWSLKAEYQYIDLGSTKLSAYGESDYGATGADYKAEHVYHTVRAGLNYHIHDEYVPLK